MLTHATTSAPEVMAAALESLCFSSPAQSSVQLYNRCALAPFSLRRPGYLSNKQGCLFTVGDVALQLCSFLLCSLSHQSLVGSFLFVVSGQALLNAVCRRTTQSFSSVCSCFPARSAATLLAAVLSTAIACTLGLMPGFLGACVVVVVCAFCSASHHALLKGLPPPPLFSCAHLSLKLLR